MSRLVRLSRLPHNCMTQLMKIRDFRRLSYYSSHPETCNAAAFSIYSDYSVNAHDTLAAEVLKRVTDTGLHNCGSWSSLDWGHHEGQDVYDCLAVTVSDKNQITAHKKLTFIHSPLVLPTTNALVQYLGTWWDDHCHQKVLPTLTAAIDPTINRLTRATRLAELQALMEELAFSDEAKAIDTYFNSKEELDGDAQSAHFNLMTIWDKLKS